jgi:flagellar motility protein MotE (MotC chaperone)
MSSRVRLLPALIGAAGVLLMLRLGAMAASTAEEAPAEAEKPTTAVEAPPAEAAATEKKAEGADPSAHVEGSAVPAAGSTQKAAAPVGQAQTKGEAEVLQNLTQRRDALDARERDLALREQLMSATEKQVAARLDELKALEKKLEGMMAQRDAAEEAQIASLVKTYEAMKPPEAAKIFNKLDRGVLLMVAQRMKPAKIAVVLGAMDPVRAQDLTVMLAMRMSLAKPAPVEPAVVAPPAAAPVPQPQAAAEPVAPPPT